jgi:hypothetical protein
MISILALPPFRVRQGLILLFFYFFTFLGTFTLLSCPYEMADIEALFVAFNRI